MTADQTEKNLAKVETYKLESCGLASDLKEQYESDASHFDDCGYQLMKFHGSYQQDDRDLRTERRKAKMDKAWIFMLRVKIPGGKISAEQYLAFDRMADDMCNQTIRITSRQGIQFHGIGKVDLKNMIQAIDDIRMTTQGACGDINRNIMCCPVCDLDSRSSLHMQKLCDEFAHYFRPHSTAFYEVFCDGSMMGSKVTPNRTEPLYGDDYLPRKFKMAIAVPEDNCVDLYTQDLGIEAVHENGKIEGYDLIVGGGLGFHHGVEATYPRVGTRLARVEPAGILQAAEAVVLIQKEHGDRTNRKHARLKYTIDDMGLDGFRDELNKRMGRELEPAGPMPDYSNLDHLGWHEIGGNDQLYVGLHITNGRIQDDGQGKLKTGLHEIISRYQPQVRLTPRQNIILAGIKARDRSSVEAMMREHGLCTDEGTSRLNRLAMACPALPTCGLALAEAERYIPKLLKELESDDLGAKDIEIRMTGCPNCCVRSPMAEIGIIGRGPGRYAIYLGGNQENTRLAFLYCEKILEKDIAALVGNLTREWENQKQNGQSFGDWAWSRGPESLQPLLPDID
jgi:sulfite reductase (ferredoxin)